jgi:hypothetical protein
MKKRISRYIASAALAASLPLSGALFAVEFQGQDPPAASGQQDPSSAQMFSGKITKANGKYLLRDSSGKTAYMLDDQKAAKAYEGKVVMITGTLDEANNLIHVQKIEAAA